MRGLYVVVIIGLLVLACTGCATPAPVSECATLRQEVTVFAACKDIGCYPTLGETVLLEQKLGRCQEALGASPRS